ncbi:hypothetical protein D3C80_1128140 [compost metagenome]
MEVTERHPEGIRRIRLRGGRELEQMGHHMLYLLLGCPARAHYRLLDLGRRVFAHRQQGVDRRHYGAAPRLTELQGGIGVAGHEDPLYGEVIGLELGDDLAHPVIHLLEARRQLAQVGADAARPQVLRLARDYADDAVAGDPRTGVYAQNNAHEGITLSAATGRSSAARGRPGAICETLLITLCCSADLSWAPR